MKNCGKSRARHDGFVLLEIIVSIALFALIGTAMVAALEHLAKTSRLARYEVAMQRRFDSLLAEVIHGSGERPTFGNTVIPPDGSGIGVTIEITPETISNREGAPLEFLYRIRLVGRMENDPQIERESMRIVYIPPQARTT